MRYRILGPLAITEGSEQVRLSAPKHRAVLLCLLLNRNETVSVDRLLDALWPEGPPSRALKTLQLYVSQVRVGPPPAIEQRLHGRIPENCSRGTVA